MKRFFAKLLLVMSLAFQAAAVESNAIIYNIANCVPAWPVGGKAIREFLEGYGIQLGQTDSVISSIRSQSIIITTSRENHGKIETLIEESGSIAATNRFIEKLQSKGQLDLSNDVELREFFNINPGLVVMKRRDRLQESIAKAKQSGMPPDQLATLEADLANTNKVLGEVSEVQKAFLIKLHKALQSVESFSEKPQDGTK